MTFTPLSVLGLSDRVIQALRALRIESVEVFAGRVVDPAAADSLRRYLELEPAVMQSAVESALALSPPHTEQRSLGGALIRNRSR